MPKPILNVAAYKFATLNDLPTLREQLRRLTAKLDLRGTILLAPEGINLFLAGEEEKLERFLGTLLEDPRFTDMPVKRSYSSDQPFNRMLVKIKREIITMNQPDIKPAEHAAPRITARELQRWLDEGREVVLLDTRNRFEVDVGTFNGAEQLGIDAFSQFPEKLKAKADAWSDKTVVTFCTGGIRCEKAAPFMLANGFKEVYQLDGGILKYFEECGDAHYEGECFVFDKRVAVDGELQETQTAQCYVCQEVVSPEQQRSIHYKVGVSCPKCAPRQRAA
ncbi:MAG TPA: sulfurtransferase [Burkholderiales bacterium]|nr:sulfurtransferase [Burkholderiales bacterium]